MKANEEIFNDILEKIERHLDTVNGVSPYDLQEYMACNLKLDYDVMEETIGDQNRWSISCYDIYKIVVNGDKYFFSFSYEKPATEMQEWGCYFEIRKVVPMEITKTIYVETD